MIKYEAVKAHVILLEVEIVVDDRLERDSNLGLLLPADVRVPHLRGPVQTGGSCHHLPLSGLTENSPWTVLKSLSVEIMLVGTIFLLSQHIFYNCSTRRFQKILLLKLPTLSEVSLSRFLSDNVLFSLI